MVISTKDKRVDFLGKTVEGGKIHDYALLKKEFPPQAGWFAKQRLFVDLGYTGIGKDYQIGTLGIPFKRPRRSKKNPDPKLTPQQLAHNQYIGKNRIGVENALCGMKRYHLLCTKYRGKSIENFDSSIEL